MIIDKENDVIVIFGPTGAGKSTHAINLATKLDGVIINADSVQVYKEAPILSNIPTTKEQQIVPHKLFGFLNLTQEYSVAKWLVDVKNAIIITQKQNKIPIVVGGSGLYISSLIDGISNIPSSNYYKQEAINLFNDIGHEEFLKLVASFDKETTLRFFDKQRLIRAYEVFHSSGRSLSSFQKEPKQIILKRNFINMYITKERNQLYENINLRFKKMFEQGAVTEVQKIQSIYNSEKILKKVIGLYEINLFLNGLINKEKAIFLGSKKTRNYAKKQITWFNNKIINKNIFNFF